VVRSVFSFTFVVATGGGEEDALSLVAGEAAAGLGLDGDAAGTSWSVDTKTVHALIKVTGVVGLPIPTTRHPAAHNRSTSAV